METHRFRFHAFRVHRKVLRLALVLACGLAVMSGRDLLSADDETGYRGRRLVDVLREFQKQGMDLIFSSAVVGKDLRVSVEPSTAEPRGMLEEILLPLGLQAEDGPAGSILILPASGKPGNLSGRVLSVSGGRPIVGASIHVPQTGDSTFSDADGFFEVGEIPVGTYKVVVDAVGFVPTSVRRVRISEDPDAELIVELAAQPAFVTEVVVTPNRHSVVREEQASRRTLTSEEAALAPTTGGDISRVVELLPGIAAADNSAAFHVRGSVARDVSMVLDGLELYDPFHLQGFQSPFSLIDSNVVDRIDFFGGGFTADLGDRHGGFVEISTLVPQETPHGELEIGTLNSRISYRNPTSKSGAWLISARGWYPEAVRATTELGGGENLDPRFVDVYAKAAFNISPRHRLSAHSLLAYDRLSFQESGETVNESVEARTKSGYAWVRTLSAWSTNLTSETLLSGGRIERKRDGVSEVDEPVLVDDDRAVDFFGLKHDSTWQISDSHVLKVGADVRWLDAEYRYFVADAASSTMIQLDPNGTSLGIYAAHRARVTSTLATELGLRWDRQTHTNDNQLSPRFNAVWRPGQRSEVRLALGSFSQSQRIHELQVEDGETEFSRAEVAKQVELSFQRALPAGLRFRVDAYYRELSDVRPRYENLYEPVELFPETTDDRILVAPEEARLRGVEWMLRGDVNRPLFWWVTYTLASAEDLGAVVCLLESDLCVIDGDVFRSWDQTHAGRVLIGYRQEDRWSVSLHGSIHTGWPITPAEVTTNSDIEPVLDERNTDRYPTYVRFDFKTRYSFPLPRGRLSLTLEVLNLTDRDNACCVDEFQAVTQPSGEFEVRTLFDYWLGITPSFSVLWEF